MLPFAQLLTVRIGGVRIAGAALKGPARRRRPCPFPSTFHFKEISEWPARRKKNPNAPATASWMRPSTCSCPRGGQHHHGRHRRPRRRVQGAVYGHYKNKIDVCVAMSDRALAAAVALTRVHRRQGAGVPVRVDAAIRAHLLGRGVDAARAGNPVRQVRAERRERAAAATTGHLGTPCPAQFRKTAARRGAQRRPARRAGRAPVQRLPALPDRGGVRQHLLVRSPEGRYLAARRAHARAAIDTLRFSAPASGPPPGRCPARPEPTIRP